MTTTCKHERSTTTRGRASVNGVAVPSHARNYPVTAHLRHETSNIREPVATYAAVINSVGKLYQQRNVIEDSVSQYAIAINGIVKPYKQREGAIYSGVFDHSYLNDFTVSPLVAHDSSSLAKLVVEKPVDVQDKIKIMTPDDELLAQSDLTPEEIQSIDAIAESILTQFGVAVEHSKIWLDVWTEADPTVNKELYIRDADVATIVDLEWAFTRALVEADISATRKNKYLIHFMPSAE